MANRENRGKTTGKKPENGDITGFFAKKA